MDDKADNHRVSKKLMNRKSTLLKEVEKQPLFFYQKIVKNGTEANTGLIAINK